MGTLTYTTTMSLDGYVGDDDGNLQLPAPSADVFTCHVDRISTVSVEVLGRKTYALMDYWMQDPADVDWNADQREFARYWRGIDKIAVSSTLRPEDLRTQQGRLIAELTLPELRRIVDEAPGAVEIFGPTTAAAAITAGMVDDFHLFTAPATVGGGLRALPDGALLDLDLAGHRVFDDGTIYTHYRTRR